MTTADKIQKIYNEMGYTGFSCWIPPHANLSQEEAEQELLTILTNFRDGVGLIPDNDEVL